MPESIAANLTPKTPGRSILRGVLCLGLFFLGLWGGCWAIREALPFPEVPAVKSKVEYFAAHHDDYDTLFLGSSRVYFQIIPAIFDPLAAAQGLPTHSFNAGIADLRPPEDAYYLDQLLRQPPRHLRWVFIELSNLRPGVNPNNTGTLRAVYWHDTPRLWILFQRTLFALSAARSHRWKHTLENASEPLDLFSQHCALYLQNLTNLGRGSIFTGRFLDLDLPPPALPGETLGDDLAGWIPSGAPEIMTGPALATYDKELAERRAQKQRGDPGDPVSQQAHEAMIAKIEKLGATPVLVVTPTIRKTHFIPTPERARKTLVLDFSDLDRFPELYEQRYRLDNEHLNTAGAKVFTRLFAQTWADEVKRQR